MRSVRLANIELRYGELVAEIGRKAAAALFPRDFDFYLVSLELVDSDGVTVDLFTFPVMPSEISEERTELTTIKKSAKGITSIKTPTFIPRQISISGDFGRKFKVVFGDEVTILAGFLFNSIREGTFNKENLFGNFTKIKQPVFSSPIKTGFGCTKVLESMVDKSLGFDSKGKPYNLFFYNPTLGNNYLVNTKTLRFNQDKESSNMIWKYSLSMTAVANLEQLEFSNANSLINAFVSDFINKQASNLVNKITNNLGF